jgi:hypothetical protein
LDEWTKCNVRSASELLDHVRLEMLFRGIVAYALKEMTWRGGVVIVTGGGSALGQEVAYRLGAEGSHVAVAVRSADQLAETVDRIEALGGSASAFAIDI